jgi:hypothetical protein
MNLRHTNILAVYSRADADSLREGLTWYRQVNEEADRLADENDLTVRQTSAIIAAVSPGLRFERNIEAAERIIKREPLTGLGVRWFDGVRKAKKILAGHNPDVVLKGNKVKNFAACIADPSNTLSVCIDGHMFSCWAGKRITLDEVPPINNRLYHRIAGDFCFVARVLGVRPMQVQAVCWLVWRKQHGVA